MNFNTTDLSRFNTSWGNVGYINQGKYCSTDGVRHWVSYANFGGFNIDYNKQTISKVTISFTAAGGRYSDDTKIGVYFGLSKEDAKKLQQGTDLFTSQRYIETIEAHGKSGATRTIILNTTGLNQFMTYFNSTKPSLVFFSETDRGANLTTAGTYSYNYVQLSNLILTVETTPKAASFSNLPSQIVIDQDSVLNATALSGSYTYKAIWKLGSKTASITGTQSGTVVSFKTNIPASWGSEFPTTTSASGSVTIETYSGSSKIGSNTNTITYSTPTYSVSTSRISFSNPSGSTYYNSSGIVYLHNLSKIGISITPTTSYGSGLQKVEVIYNGKTASHNFPESGNFTQNLTLNKNSGNVTIKIYDRRGKSGSISKTYTVSSDLPSLTNLVVTRSSSTGVNQFDGTNLKITGTSANASGLTLKYGTTLGTYNKSATLTSKTGYWHTTSSVFNTDLIYYLQITVTSSKYYTNSDKTTRLTQTYLSQLESSAYLMHFNTAGNGVGIGGAAEAGKIKLHWPTTFSQGVSISGQTTFNGAVSFNTSLPITQGGTGATTASTARSNLGITPANIKALSLSGGTLTGTLTAPHMRIYKESNKWPCLEFGWENNAFRSSIFASIKNEENSPYKTMTGFFIQQIGSKYGEFYTLIPNARNDKDTWHRIHSDKTHYPEIEHEEEITFSNEIFMGYITTSGKDVFLTVPMAKSLQRAESVSITQMNGRLRCDGNYAIGNASAAANFLTGLANSSATIKKTTNSIIIYLNYQSALGDSCNNKPCVAAITTMKLKFTNPSYVI